MDIVTASATVGFPIAVAVWLLYEGRANQKEVKQAIQNNTIALNRLTTIIEMQTKERD